MKRNEYKLFPVKIKTRKTGKHKESEIIDVFLIKKHRYVPWIIRKLFGVKEYVDIKFRKFYKIADVRRPNSSTGYGILIGKVYFKNKRDAEFIIRNYKDIKYEGRTIYPVIKMGLIDIFGERHQNEVYEHGSLLYTLKKAENIIHPTEISQLDAVKHSIDRMVEEEKCDNYIKDSMYA